MSNAAPQFKGVIRPATYEDCLTLAPNLRQEDKDEVWESHGYLPEEALIISFKASPNAQVGTINGEIVCMFGVAPDEDSHRGSPWMLASDLIKDVSGEFLRRDKEVLRGMSAGYTFLFNYAWSKNTMHLRWLKWLGFTIDKDPVPIGRNREIFYGFYKFNEEQQCLPLV